jgi:hypothetical protein
VKVDSWHSNQDFCRDAALFNPRTRSSSHLATRRGAPGHFEPEKFEYHYETALVDLINSKRSGKPITPRAQPRGENVVDLMDALRKQRRPRSGRSRHGLHAGQEILAVLEEYQAIAHRQQVLACVNHEIFQWAAELSVFAEAATACGSCPHDR